MAVLDRYVDEMSKQKADALVLAANKVIELHVRGEVRPVTSRPVTNEQLAGLMREIGGPDFMQRLSNGIGVFQHRAPSGPVSVTVVNNHLGMTLTVESADPPSSGQATVFAAHPSFPPLAGRAATPPSPPSIVPAGRATGSTAPVGTKGGPIPASIEELFDQMLDLKASDLHLKSGKAPVVRIDGRLRTLEGRARLSAEVLTRLIYSVTPERNIKEFEKFHDTDFAHEVQRARLRCNIFRDRTGIGACFRQISWQIKTAKELGLPPAVMEFCNYTKGLVLVTGPTGSGKSTTLAAMIDTINETRDTHIITVEDPIEFVHQEKRSHVNQREVGTQTRSFKAALRAALREDPDIVLVGEMRDLETVAIAIETAETGHLVFGTLHTNTAASTIDRIINQFPSERQAQIRTMLADSLRGVVAQTLVKRKNGGRAAAQEIMIVNQAISNLIREGKSYQIGGIMQTSRSIGMQTMNDSLLDLVKSGTVDAQEAYDHAVDKKDFASMLTRAGVKGNWD